MFQLMGAGAVLFVFLMGQGFGLRWFISLFVFVLVIGLSSWFIGSDILRAGDRLREIEDDVNRRAGENLLTWETRWARGVAGAWARRPLPPIQR